MLKFNFKILGLLFFMVTIMACSDDKPSAEIDLGDSNMPLPSGRLQKLNTRYKLAFLPDGYPGKRLKTGDIYTHPLYGTYILKDYLYQYGKDSSEYMYNSIVKLADVAIAKMTVKEDALIFYYEPCEEFGYHEKFYSSLAQSSYLIPLYKTYELTNNIKYKEAAQKVMKSLFLPIEKGGVALKTNGVFSIEEDPTKPHGIILNGWLSALTSIKQYCELSNDTLAYDLLLQSLKTLPSVLHHYDSEEYANSMYHLEGYQKFKIRFKDKNVSIINGYVDNKDGNKNEFQFLYDFKRKEKINYIEALHLKKIGDVFEPTQNEIVLNAILNRISCPIKNEIILYIENNSYKNYIEVDRMIYSYTPDKGVVETNTWEKDTVIKLTIGKNEIRIKPKWEDLSLIGYPNTFKQFDDEYHNVYHYIHIDRMEQLNELIKNDTIDFYINKWKGYTEKWPSMDIYDGMNYNPYK